MQIAYPQTFPDNKPLIGGKPTHFVEKIVKYYMKAEMFGANHLPFDFDFAACAKAVPKLHQIVADPNGDFKPGCTILHMVKGSHPAMAQFAPRANVVSTQRIEILDADGDKYIFIDDCLLLNDRTTELLAINEGFANAREFLAYYENGLIGKIVHWTALRY